MSPAATAAAFTLRVGVRALAAVAPALADRAVVRIFSTPRRRHLPPLPGGHGIGVHAHWTVASGRERLAVYSAGAGPAVLLAHGWEGSASDMVTIGNELRAGGFRVISFDMPAHGRSTGRQTTLAHMARAVRDVAQAVGPLRAVVGHSLGATAAILALREGLDAGAAVAIAPPRDPRVYLARLTTMLGLPERRLQGTIREIERWVGPMETFDAARAAASIGARTPALVLHDVGDRAVPFGDGLEIAESWPGSGFVALQGLGHRRILDTTDVVEYVVRFVATRQMPERTVRDPRGGGVHSQA